MKKTNKSKYKTITFASQDGINKYRKIADDFLKNILHSPEAWISDESSIYDFGVELEVTIKKILRIYKVDVSDIPNLNLLEIFKRIYESV